MPRALPGDSPSLRAGRAEDLIWETQDHDPHAADRGELRQNHAAPKNNAVQRWRRCCSAGGLFTMVICRDNGSTSAPLFERRGAGQHHCDGNPISTAQ
jgi:hypothetical protein